MNEENYKIFEINSDKYIFFRDYLSIYKLEDDILVDYFENRKDFSQKDKKEINNLFKEANKKLDTFSFAKVPQYLTSLCLILTRNCNLRCKYCYAFDEKKENELDMSFEIAKKAIDYLLETDLDTMGYSIVFFGGEPLMNKKIMDEVIDYCYTEIKEKRGKFVGFAMTTNGIIMNDDIAKYLKQHNFSLQVSIDGLKENHDKNRILPNGKGSYDIIIKNIDYLKKANVSFMTHSTFDTHINLYDTLIELERLKNPFSYGFTLDTLDKSKDITSYTKIELSKLRNDYEKIIEFYLNKYINNEIVYCQNIGNYLMKIKNRIGKEIGCTSGKAMISVLPNGTIIPCQNFQKMEEFYQGNITDNVIYQNTVYANHVDENETCKKCWMKYFCGGGCFYEKYINNGNTFDPPLAKCEVYKIQAEYFLKLYVKLEELGIISRLEEKSSSNSQLNI